MRKLAIWIDTKSNYTANTRSDCKKVLKRFYQWLLAPPEQYETWRDERIYAAYLKYLREAAARAGIRKKVVPYTFRHSAATRDAKLGFNEVMLCKKYGWTIGSKMPQIYLHLSSSDLFAQIAQTYGGEAAEKPRPQTLNCFRCGRGNHPSQKLCGWCGSPLHDEDIAKQSIELEEIKHKDNMKVEELESQIGDLQKKLNLLMGIPSSN